MRQREGNIFASYLSFLQNKWFGANAQNETEL
jgi:hypothetical protein